MLPAKNILILHYHYAIILIINMKLQKIELQESITLALESSLISKQKEAYGTEFLERDINNFTSAYSIVPLLFFFFLFSLQAERVFFKSNINAIILLVVHFSQKIIIQIIKLWVSLHALAALLRAWALCELPLPRETPHQLSTADMVYKNKQPEFRMQKCLSCESVR